jgi:predicted small secreted protein
MKSRKFLPLLLALALSLALLAGCGVGKDVGSAGNNSESKNSAAGGSNKAATVTLDGMKQAAIDAGYKVEDSDVSGDKAGEFLIDFPLGSSDDMLPVTQYKDKATADSYAKSSNDSGYYVAVTNGVFVALATAEKGVAKPPEEKTLLENLLSGRNLGAAPVYD